jgi:transposase
VKSTKPKATRGEILALCAQGLTTSEVSAALGVCGAWVRRVKQERRESGKVANATTRQRTPQWAAYREQIEAAIAAEPDLTLVELRQKLGTTRHPGTLCRALQTLQLTFKKKS